MKNQKERKEQVTEVREILWGLFIDEHDPRLSVAIKACNAFIRNQPYKE